LGGLERVTWDRQSWRLEELSGRLTPTTRARGGRRRDGRTPAGVKASALFPSWVCDVCYSARGLRIISSGSTGHVIVAGGAAPTGVPHELRAYAFPAQASPQRAKKGAFGLAGYPCRAVVTGATAVADEVRPVAVSLDAEHEVAGLHIEAHRSAGEHASRTSRSPPRENRAEGRAGRLSGERSSCWCRNRSRHSPRRRCRSN